MLPRAFNLGKQALRILFQHAPAGVDIAAMRSELEAVSGVASVHDLRVWTLTSGMEVVSAHLATARGCEPADVLTVAQRLLAESYGIEHATIQVEPEHASGRCHDLSW